MNIFFVYQLCTIIALHLHMVFPSYIRIEPNRHKYFGSSSKSEIKKKIFKRIPYFSFFSACEQTVPMGRDGDVHYVHMWPIDPLVLS